MPAPASYSNIILIPGRGDLGLRPLICCVTGSVLPGTYPGAAEAHSQEKGENSSYGKAKGPPQRQYKGSKLPCDLGRTRSGMEPQAFVLFYSP